MFPLSSGCLLQLTYRLIFTCDRKQVVSQVEKGQKAAEPPHIDSCSEGEAEGHFWRPEEDKDRNMIVWKALRTNMKV